MPATSVVPPPISTTMLATGSPTGRPTPIAAAFGSEIRYTSLAPARSAELTTARLSTAVIPDGMAINTLGRTPHLRLWTFVMKYLSIASVISKSAITPFLSGRITEILLGAFSSIALATFPTAFHLKELYSFLILLLQLTVLTTQFHDQVCKQACLPCQGQFPCQSKRNPI